MADIRGQSSALWHGEHKNTRTLTGQRSDAILYKTIVWPHIEEPTPRFFSLRHNEVRDGPGKR